MERLGDDYGRQAELQQPPMDAMSVAESTLSITSNVPTQIRSNGAYGRELRRSQGTMPMVQPHTDEVKSQDAKPMISPSPSHSNKNLARNLNRQAQHLHYAESTATNLQSDRPSSERMPRIPG